MSVKPVSEVVAELKELLERADASDAELIDAIRGDVPRLLDFVERSVELAEKARELLVNAYSTPDDSKGIRIQSEDAVKLQWALRAAGVGDDAGEPCFTV